MYNALPVPAHAIQFLRQEMGRWLAFHVVPGGVEPDVDNNGVDHEYDILHPGYYPSSVAGQRPDRHRENMVDVLPHPPNRAGGDHSASWAERAGAPGYRPHSLSDRASGKR